MRFFDVDIGGQKIKSTNRFIDKRYVNVNVYTRQRQRIHQREPYQALLIPAHVVLGYINPPLVHMMQRVAIVVVDETIACVQQYTYLQIHPRNVGNFLVFYGLIDQFIH